MKHDFKDLNWPKGLNLEILSSVLEEDVLRTLIAANMGRPRLKRRIILPSKRCCIKVLSHDMWRRILAGETTWEKEKKNWKKSFGTLAVLGIRKDKLKELYHSREKEIANES